MSREHPSIPLRFVFDDPEAAELSRAWIEELANSANSSGGIMLVAETFDTDPTSAAEQGGPEHTGDSVALGNVEIAHLEVDKLSVADGSLTGRSNDV